MNIGRAHIRLISKRICKELGSIAGLDCFMLCADALDTFLRK